MMNIQKMQLNFEDNDRRVELVMYSKDKEHSSIYNGITRP